MLTELALQVLTALAPAPEGAPNAEGHTMILVLFYGGLFAVFYFLLIRPQSKKNRAIRDMQSAIDKGDSVITSGGMYGTVHKVKDDVVIVQIADDVRVKFQRSAITELVKESGTKKPDE